MLKDREQDQSDQFMESWNLEEVPFYWAVKIYDSYDHILHDHQNIIIPNRAMPCLCRRPLRRLPRVLPKKRPRDLERLVQVSARMSKSNWLGDRLSSFVPTIWAKIGKGWWKSWWTEHYQLVIPTTWGKNSESHADPVPRRSGATRFLKRTPGRL